MLAHAASAQGISAVENMCGRKHTLNHLSVPAACFTHPEVSFVGLTEENAREQAEKDGYKDKIAVTKTSFKANSKVGFITPSAVLKILSVLVNVSLSEQDHERRQHSLYCLTSVPCACQSYPYEICGQPLLN